MQYQNLKIGCDIVHIPTFIESIKRSDGHVLEKIFTPQELGYGKSHTSLAGMFAAKESVIKAIGHKIDWLVIELSYQESGKPRVHVSERHSTHVLDVSIAHDGEYAIAYVLMSVEPEQELKTRSPCRARHSS